MTASVLMVKATVAKAEENIPERCVLSSYYLRMARASFWEIEP
jgi:hypothetical protein